MALHWHKRSSISGGTAALTVCSRAWLAGLVLPLLIAGCAERPAAPPPPAVPTLVEQRLADSGQRIAGALEQLSRLEQAATPTQIPPPVDPKDAPADLQMQVTWQGWRGPIEKAVKGIAERIGYKVTIHGVEPSAPVIVRVDANKMPVIQVLESIGLEAGSRATVRLEADTSIIHLYFATPKTGAL